MLRQKDGSRRLKNGLLVLVVLAMGGVLAFFLTAAFVSQPPKAVLEAVGRHTDIAIRNMKHTAVREGVKEWHLEAERAQIDQEHSRAQLQQLTVTFFTPDAQGAELTARQGVLDYTTNDITVSGDVQLQNGRCSLKSEQLQYHHDRQRLYSHLPVELVCESGRLRADSMVLDLNTERTTFKGNVDGDFEMHLNF